MSVLKVALLQLAGCGPDQAASLAIGEAACRQAKRLGADVALFPEMWNIGYTFFDPGRPDSRRAWEAQAVSREGEFVRHFAGLARELELAIAITYLETWPGGPRNSVSLIDRTGRIRLTYAKVHTCDFDLEAACTPGDDFYVCALDTAQGEVQVGAMICYDREFPESARILMLKGAELILTPNSCTLEEHRLGQFKARAFENMVGVAMANYAPPHCNGHSVAFSPVAFDNRDEQPLDTCLAAAGAEEGIYLAAFDLASIRAYREREVWGNAYRRPRCYSLLAAPEVAPPFQRERDPARR
jgi:predicted amidohydrolase